MATSNKGKTVVRKPVYDLTSEAKKAAKSAAPVAIVESVRDGSVSLTTVPLMQDFASKTLTAEDRNALLRAGARVDSIVQFAIASKGAILATAVYDSDGIKIKYANGKTGSRKHAVSEKTHKLNVRTNFQLTVTEMLRNAGIVEKAESSTRGASRKQSDAKLNALVEQIAKLTGKKPETVLAEMQKKIDRDNKAAERKAAKPAGKSAKAQNGKAASKPRASKPASKPAVSEQPFAPAEQSAPAVDAPVDTPAS